MFIFFKKFLFSLIFCLTIFTSAKSEILKKIYVEGNNRVSDETIIIFSLLSVDIEINSNLLNEAIKSLYETNFFNNVTINVNNGIATIYVIENPIIENVSYENIKSNDLKQKITEGLSLRSRSSFNDVILREDRNKIINSLKNLGYFSPTVEIAIEELSDNKVDLIFNINIGEKAKIKKISFLGNKVFKESKLKNIIISEEYRFWKFISGKKYLNYNVINFEKRLLKNFYLNKGYYNVKINSSFAKIINDNDFELIFNIDAGKRFEFGDLRLKLPFDYDKKNYEKLINKFESVKGKNYSIDVIKEILDEIDLISIDEQYQSVNALVEENIVENIINLQFIIEESELFIVEKINIYGNNVTDENVIRNKLLVDEGDPYNDILLTKTKNILNNLNIFRSVKTEVLDSKLTNSKIINIYVEEKPTGEIAAGAGVGTSGGTIFFSIKENNYLGKGTIVNANIELDKESVKGSLSTTFPNYKNTDKSITMGLEADETDRLENFGYKSNKTGFTIGTNFEYFKDFSFGIANSTYYEKIETDNTASERQKKQEGDYLDSFLKLNFDYDKRNQKYKTNRGFRSFYSIDLPIVSDTYSLSSSYDYKYFTEFFENNISTFGFSLKGISSITGENVKLSERLFVPSNKLRGFVRGKVGPKDGDDFVGGNYLTTFNFTTTLPQILDNLENLDFLIFLDAANNWGVDYDSSISDSSKIRSSIGLGVDWWTPIGPLNFSFSQNLSKNSTDKIETFRFNLGTTF
jgi:outer membrane protein insertion porin family